MKRSSKPKRPFGGPEEEVFVSLQRTADILARKVEQVLRAADVTPQQYNVLRILRGAPEGCPAARSASA